MAFSTTLNKAPSSVAGRQQSAMRPQAQMVAGARRSAPLSSRANGAFSGLNVASAAPKASQRASRGSLQTVAAIADGAKLDRPLRVAVIGGGPSGACAAETLAAGGVETFLFERKMDNCKVRKGERRGPASPSSGTRFACSSLRSDLSRVQAGA
jgi:geranylgeranyl reductase